MTGSKRCCVNGVKASTDMILLFCHFSSTRFFDKPPELHRFSIEYGMLTRKFLLPITLSV